MTLITATQHLPSKPLPMDMLRAVVVPWRGSVSCSVRVSPAPPVAPAEGCRMGMATAQADVAVFAPSDEATIFVVLPAHLLAWGRRKEGVGGPC